VALNLEKKKALVTDLAGIATKAVSAIAADYRGLTVAEMTELRTNARRAGVKMGVYRNTLARRAIKETPYACLDQVLTGPMVLLFSLDEPGAAARLVRNFVKDHERFEVKALALGGALLSADKLKAVASLPSRQDALTQLVVVLAAPITKFVRTLNEPVAQTARVLAAVGEKKKTAA
jgi:large subunit ribosomal protein L10